MCAWARLCAHARSHRLQLIHISLFFFCTVHRSIFAGFRVGVCAICYSLHSILFLFLFYSHISRDIHKTLCIDTKVAYHSSLAQCASMSINFNSLASCGSKARRCMAYTLLQKLLLLKEMKNLWVTQFTWTFEHIHSKWSLHDPTVHPFIKSSTYFSIWCCFFLSLSSIH